jgi:hypothetical protein
MVAMLGFAGLVFADSGKQVHRVGPGAKIAKPLAVNDQGPGTPKGTTRLRLGTLTGSQARRTTRAPVRLPLPLNRTVIATTAGAADDYQTPATDACYQGLGQLPSTAPGRDIVFSFQALRSRNYSFRIIQQGPNADPTRTQNPVLYAVDGTLGCPAPGVVNCLEGANRPSRLRSSARRVPAATSRKRSPACRFSRAACILFFDDHAVAGTAPTPAASRASK